MASPPNESRTLASYLDFDEDVDYGSDTNVPEDEGELSDHLCLRQDLLQHPIRPSKVLKPPRLRRSVIQSIQVNA